jgi:prolyl-tRNA editing enzyme YbaK/EbsC (Cys-tRNA(Pro) deacylase)
VEAELPRASRRLFESVDFDPDIRVFPEGTKTAEDAARAVGCPVAAIVKSLVFVVDDVPVVALVPGDLRLDTSRLAAAAGGTSARRATLDEVREATGYSAGGTPPFGHARQLRVFADPVLKRNDPVWAAAGTPTSVFSITIRDLDRLASPVWVTVT